MADARKGFLLRLPPPLLAELRRWAAQEMRSTNGQIEWLLREAVRRRTRPDPHPDDPGDVDGDRPSGPADR